MGCDHHFGTSCTFLCPTVRISVTIKVISVIDAYVFISRMREG